MSRQQTCAEILLNMSKTIERYPRIIKTKGKEFVSIINKNKNWDMYIYKSHGNTFVKVIENINNETLIEIESKMLNR